MNTSTSRATISPATSHSQPTRTEPDRSAGPPTGVDPATRTPYHRTNRRPLAMAAALGLAASAAALAVGLTLPQEACGPDAPQAVLVLPLAAIAAIAALWLATAVIRAAVPHGPRMAGVRRWDPVGFTTGVLALLGTLAMGTVGLGMAAFYNLCIPF